MPPTVPYNKIYLDNLPNDPSFGDASNTSIKIVDVCYNFGIPSVRTFQIDLSRNFHNLHSQYKFLPEDRKILNIESNSTGKSWVIIDDNAESANSLSVKSVKLKPIAAKISGVKSKNKELITLNVSGDYNLSHTDFSNIQGYYTSSITASNRNIGWTETLKNLRGPRVVPKSLTHNHYCDYGSFDPGNDQQINQPKLDLDSRVDNITICEISNISLLGSNLGGIIAREYKDHTKRIQDHTLLYINGKFQTNRQEPYPNTLDFSWNGHSSIQHFSAGTTSYGTNGQSSTNNLGYKWIGFKLNANILIFNQQTQDYKLELYGNSGLLTIFFNQKILDELKSNSDNAIGFVQQKGYHNGAVITRIGNIKKVRNDINLWTELTNSSDLEKVSYSSFSQAVRYGACLNHNNRNLFFSYNLDNNPHGIDSDIYLYIGIKNNFLFS